MRQIFRREQFPGKFLGRTHIHQTDAALPNVRFDLTARRAQVRVECLRRVRRCVGANTQREITAHRAVFGLASGIGRDVAADTIPQVISEAVVHVALRDAAGADVPVRVGHIGPKEPGSIAGYEALGVELVTIGLPTAPERETLEALDRLAEIVAKVG